MADPLQPEQGNEYNPEYVQTQSFMTPAASNWFPPFSSHEPFNANIPPPNVSCNVPPPNFERHSEYSTYENQNCTPVVSYKDKFSALIFVPPFPPPPVSLASVNKPPPITQSITSYVDTYNNSPNCDLPERYYQNKHYPDATEFVQYPILPPKYDKPSTYKDSLNLSESHMNIEEESTSFNEQWGQSSGNFNEGNEWNNYSRNQSEYDSYSGNEETSTSNMRNGPTVFDNDSYNVYQHDGPRRYRSERSRSQSPTRKPHSRSETPARRKRSRSRSVSRRKSMSRQSSVERSTCHNPKRRSKNLYGTEDRSSHCRSPDRKSSCRSPDKRSSSCRSPDKRSLHRSTDKRSSRCRRSDKKSSGSHRPRKAYTKSEQRGSQEIDSKSSRPFERNASPSGLSCKSVHSESGMSNSSKISSKTHSACPSRNYEKRSTDISWTSRRSSEEPSRSPNNSVASKQSLSERESLLEKWRENYCATRQEMQAKLVQLSKMKPEEIIEHEKKVWTRAAPADLYYTRDGINPIVMRATPRQLKICQRFSDDLVTRAEKVRQTLSVYEPPPRKNRMKVAKHKSEVCSSSDSNEESSTDEEDCTMEELERKRLHPHRLHSEMWYNDSGEMNDGPLCRCSAKARRHGIRHGIYAGEHHLLKCDVNTNNADKLHHYRITISPPTNFLTKTPTIIKHDEHEFIFEGFSMFSHFPLEKLPTCKVIRFNIEYTILYIHEKLPENFTIRELDLFHDYLFEEVLELIDLDCKASGDSAGCSQFHFMPRFVRDLPDNGKEVLSMNEVLIYLLDNSKPLLDKSRLGDLMNMPQFRWQNFADEVKGMVVTYPGKKPCSVRVDQLDRDQRKHDPLTYPEIVHFGIRPPQLSYAGNPEYQKAWREYVKFRHLLANMPKPSYEDKRKLEAKENKLQEMRTQSKMKRDVTVAVSAEGFHRTGIMCDMIQHAMLIPVLVCHLRFHRSCDTLEKVIDYKFENRFLLQLALTHPSYRENFGTNPDHARNSLTNCGIRQPEYGDRRIHYMNTRKRGINTLINIMSRFGKKQETESNITHNERLEFLGDAVVEFLTSIHLFHMFPELEEGGLATYRAALVQNQHLAVLAKTLNLEEFMLYAHGSDLCHDLELRHAMANCFEALMGALFMDGGIEVADKVFAGTLFRKNDELLDVWVNYPPHPLQEQEPQGDRKWIPSFELLQKISKFEQTIGVDFKHIRLLARAFTDRSIGYTNLTLGSNQRLEFLGDTVLQLIASEYLYRFFPEHHEGHLSLLRSSLVNNRTQAVVCDDLGMTSYALYAHPKGELKTKDRADLLEAFLGALYIDKGLEHCHVFCHVCFFPRLQDFIMNQDWNDPKSKLQQCCLTLRTMEGGEPDIPLYKVIECKGPTNTRVYTVAVYFRGERLAKASGHSIQMAEMNAAREALTMSQDLFPQLDHQKRVIAKSMKKQRWPNRKILRGRPKR